MDESAERSAAEADGIIAPETERIAAVARRQHGLITRAQLQSVVGLSGSAIDRRVKAARLRPLQRGVYLEGPLAPPGSRERAVVLACGHESYISHRTAASLWEMLPRAKGPTPVHVTVVGADRGRRPGTVPHRVASIFEGDTARVSGIPVTAPGRTLIDLAAVVGGGVLERAMARALRSGILTESHLWDTLGRHAGRPGIGGLRKLLEREGGPAFTRSEAERRFLDMIRAGRLPVPELNAQVAGYEVDFLWRELRVVVEVDGFRFHGSRVRFEADRRRDVDLASAGVQVLRVTWRQLVQDERATLVKLAQVLVHRARHGKSRRPAQ